MGRANRFSGDKRERNGTPEVSRAKREAAAIRAELEDAEAEMAFERLAAFGPGVDVVNILTGERFRT